jgi:hypothetical protein
VRDVNGEIEDFVLTHVNDNAVQLVTLSREKMISIGRETGLVVSRTISSATNSASSTLRNSSRMIVNSSPPMRATVSEARTSSEEIRVGLPTTNLYEDWGG